MMMISMKRNSSSSYKEQNSDDMVYGTKVHKELAKEFQNHRNAHNGTTITNVGFYGPQSRRLRLAPSTTKN
jgi:uridine phosphorylase